MILPCVVLLYLLLLNLDKKHYADFFSNYTVKRMGSIQYNNTNLTNAPPNKVSWTYD